MKKKKNNKNLQPLNQKYCYNEYQYCFTGQIAEVHIFPNSNTM